MTEALGGASRTQALCTSSSPAAAIVDAAASKKIRVSIDSAFKDFMVYLGKY
jgi:hypothetical protein